MHILYFILLLTEFCNEEFFFVDAYDAIFLLLDHWTHPNNLEMSVSYKYWDDCVDPEEMQLLWKDADVCKEWIDAGEKMGKKVLLSRDPEGQLYLTQTEMRVYD